MSLKVKLISLEYPEGKVVEVKPGELLTQCAYRAGITIQQTCGGTPSCTDCKIKVLEGQKEAFEPPEGPEIRLLGNVYFITHERLACQARVKSDCTIEVPKPQRRPEKVLRKPQRQDTFASASNRNSKRGMEYGKKEESQKNQKDQSQKSKFEKEKVSKGKKN